MAKPSSVFLKDNRQLYLLLLLPCALLFARSFSFGFTPMDEQWMIVRNTAFFKDLRNLVQVLTDPVAEVYYRPVLMASFFLDYQLSGAAPVAYHAVNLLLHLFCVVLAFKTFLLFIGDRKLAFYCSLVFSVHPLIAHAVAWVPGRNDLLLCIFTLLSLNSLVRFCAEGKSRQLFLHFLFFILALMTKESAVPLPLLYFFVFMKWSKGQGWSRWFILAGWCLLSLALIIVHQLVVTGKNELLAVDGRRILNLFLSLSIYLGKSVVPVFQSVLPQIERNAILLGIAVLFIILLLVRRVGVKNRNAAGAGALLFLALLLVPAWFTASRGNGELYEHRAYTSLIGLLLVFSQLNLQGLRSGNYTRVFLVVIAFFWIKTFVRINVYRDKEHFLEAGIKERPDHFLFYYQRGDLLYDNRDFSGAVRDFDKAIQLRPDRGDLYSNRGSAYFELGNYSAAVADFTEAIRLSGFRMEYLINRCMSYVRLGDKVNARKDYEVLKKCCNNFIPPPIREFLEE